MADMTDNERLARIDELERMLTGPREGVVCPHDIRRRIAELRKAEPEPKFEVDDWVWARDANRAYRVSGHDGKWLRLDRLDGTHRDCLPNEIEQLGFDLLNLARRYHNRKLISTAGLPELPEGWEYTGEYRWPAIGESYCDVRDDGEVSIETIGIDGFNFPRLIIRRKEPDNG